MTSRLVEDCFLQQTLVPSGRNKNVSVFFFAGPLSGQHFFLVIFLVPKSVSFVGAVHCDGFCFLYDVIYGPNLTYGTAVMPARNSLKRTRHVTVDPGGSQVTDFDHLFHWNCTTNSIEFLKKIVNFFPQKVEVSIIKFNDTALEREMKSLTIPTFSFHVRLGLNFPLAQDDGSVFSLTKTRHLGKVGRRKLQPVTGRAIWHPRTTSVVLHGDTM